MLEDQGGEERLEKVTRPFSEREPHSRALLPDGDALHLGTPLF